MPESTTVVECSRCGAEYARESWDKGVCPKCHLVRLKLEQLEAHQARLRLDRSILRHTGPALDVPAAEASPDSGRSSVLRRAVRRVSRALWPPAPDERADPRARRGRILLVSAGIVGVLAETVFGLQGLALGIAVGIGVPLVVGGASLFLAGQLFLLDIDLRTAILANAVMTVVAGVLLLAGWFIHPGALAAAVLLTIAINVGLVNAVFGCGLVRAILFFVVWGFVSTLIASGFASWRAFSAGR